MLSEGNTEETKYKIGEYDFSNALGVNVVHVKCSSTSDETVLNDAVLKLLEKYLDKLEPTLNGKTEQEILEARKSLITQFNHAVTEATAKIDKLEKNKSTADEVFTIYWYDNSSTKAEERTIDDKLSTVQGILMQIMYEMEKELANAVFG